MSSSPLFQKLIAGGMFGEIHSPNMPQPEPTPAQRRAAGQVQLESGEWVHHTEAVLLPKGKGMGMRWVRLN